MGNWFMTPRPFGNRIDVHGVLGSHQDAIKKGLAALDKAGIWDVPYLPI